MQHQWKRSHNECRHMPNEKRVVCHRTILNRNTTQNITEKGETMQLLLLHKVSEARCVGVM